MRTLFDRLIDDNSGYASDDSDPASLQAPDPVNIYEDIARPITIPLRLGVIELQPSSMPRGHVMQISDFTILSSVHSIRAGALTAFFSRLIKSRDTATANLALGFSPQQAIFVGIWAANLAT